MYFPAPPPRYGRQPIENLLRKRRISCAQLARETGVTYKQLYNTVRGRTIPSPQLRDQLPAALSTPLSKLFTRQVLALSYNDVGPKRKIESGAA